MEQCIAELQTGLEQYQADGEKAEQFISIVKKYTNFTELTPSMLNEFIEKITVYEAEKINGRRKQRVDIHLNFIGQFILPNQAEISEEEESEPYDPAEANRQKQRRYYHKNREKILAKLAKERAELRAKKLSEKPTKIPEEIAAQQQEKWDKKREYQREYQRKWREQNSERLGEIQKKHRMKKRVEKSALA